MNSGNYLELWYLAHNRHHFTLHDAIKSDKEMLISSGADVNAVNKVGAFVSNVHTLHKMIYLDSA